MKTNSQNPLHRRNGFSIAISILCLMLLFTITALVVDLGYLHNARAELQRSADAAALSACWKLGEQYAITDETEEIFEAVRAEAQSTASSNDVCNRAPNLDETDVEFGYLSDFSDRNAIFDTSDPSRFNAVRVRVRRTNAMNGKVSSFFAKALGVDGFNAEFSATAAIVRGVMGFKSPANGGNLDILPFALDLQTWNDMLDGNGGDSYSWNSETGQVESGSDTVLEVDLYPQDTGAPGNRGTVDIGGHNNSTTDIARQIVYGISPEDMELMGGSLEFDENGELSLDGDTGISAGVKDEIASIIGETRIIPIFSNVQSPGDNANYTIVQWVGVRILDVKLTGPDKKKHLTVQPAVISSEGVIPQEPSNSTSNYVYSKAFLVR